MKRRLLAFVVTAIVLTSGSASAQLFEISRLDEARAVSMATDAAYDPVHDCYFMITGWPDVVTGQFLDRAGRPAGPAITLSTTQQSFFVSATVYSPDVSDGAGGRGGFLALWVGASGQLVAQIVSFPGRLVGPATTIFGALGEFRSGDVGYSSVDRRFLVAFEYRKWGTIDDAPSRLVVLDVNIHPIGEVALSSDPNHNCFFEYLEMCDVHVEWNPISREFGVLYPQESVTTNKFANSERVFARVSGDGVIVSRATLGLGSGASALAVNTHSGNYVVLGSTPTVSVYGVELDVDGQMVARGRASGSLDFFNDCCNPLKLFYSRASGTFLLGGHVRPPLTGGMVLELNQHGVSMGSTLPIGADWFFGASAHPTAPEWIVATRDTMRIIGTTAPFGGSSAMLPDCLTPDPFASLGGGLCVNRGWLPPGHPLIPPGPPPPPPPPPPSALCTIPDPFTSLGGGVCVNGGWVPRGHPLAGGGS
jgi:hypothetical protein